MDWTLDDDMVDGLFFCARLRGHRESHNPFVQVGVETSDTGVEVVKPNPCTVSFLVVEVQDCQHCFCSAEL